jgi:hypothetical protein
MIPTALMKIWPFIPQPITTALVRYLVGQDLLIIITLWKEFILKSLFKSRFCVQNKLFSILTFKMGCTLGISLLQSE